MAIVLLTDFGAGDTYVGVMKGVMLRMNPAGQFIDLSHGIEPQNVRQAAVALMTSYRYFPKGTVFLVVVDPGVGTTRRPIAVSAGGYLFVAPDNGVLSYTLNELGSSQAVELTIDDDAAISNTFHGRDVFAPAAARLAMGKPLTSLGIPLPKILSLPEPQLDLDGRRVTGEIIHIDRFGNLVTSIGGLRWVTPERLMLKPAFGMHSRPAIPVYAESSTVVVNNQRIVGIKQTYGEAERGSLLVLVGSTAFLEVSVNQGNAASRLDAVIGDRVELEIGEFDATVLD